MSNLKPKALPALPVRLLCALGSFALIAGSLPCEAKRTSFLTPTYEKLTEGASPDTNDISARRPVRAAALTPSLAPISLDGDGPGTDVSTGAASAENGVLKMNVTATGFAPKGPIDSAGRDLLAPKSISTDKISKAGILNQARDVNVMPLPLMETAAEADQKLEVSLTAEQQQLSDLWESALTRSPDIQFVVQKLMPTNNPGHAQTVMMRMLSSALFTAMNAATMMSPSAGTIMMNTAGTSVLSNLLGAQESKLAKNARLSQTEGIMLYTIVRSTADKLVENYRNYKKTISTASKAKEDLDDLQNMVAEARVGQDSAKQIEMEYTIKKAQREIEQYEDDVKKYRQSLVDLAGPDAVAKLEKQIDDERIAIEQQTAAGTPTAIQHDEDGRNSGTL